MMARVARMLCGLGCAAALSCFGGAGPALSADCVAGEWAEIGEEMYAREGCVALSGAELRFYSIAFNLSKYKLGLAGSGEDMAVPTREDIPVKAGEDEVRQFSLNHFISGAAKSPVAASIGYPISPELFAPEGWIRIDGKEVAARDTTFEFKSAMLCLNEAGRNPGKGSRVLVFNAFEYNAPVELNPRVQDPANCPDVIQVGPRIVEYRSGRGISSSELRTPAQEYLVFSQGDGPAFYGYLTIFTEPANLYLIQEVFLADRFFSDFDPKMRVAVALTSGHHAALAVRENGGEYRTFGQINEPNPVFLTIDWDD
jgi:hypothetical protein